VGLNSPLGKWLRSLGGSEQGERLGILNLFWENHGRFFLIRGVGRGETLAYVKNRKFGLNRSLGGGPSIVVKG